jgi:thioredoxin 1
MELTEKNFNAEVLKSDIPVFVFFWVSWCTACKRMEPTIRELEQECQGNKHIKIHKVNIDMNPTIRFEYNIRQTPTYIIFNQGKSVARRIAAQSKKQLIQMLKEAVQYE